MAEIPTKEEDWTNVPSKEEMWLRRSHLVRMEGIPEIILQLHSKGAKGVSVGSYYRQSNYQVSDRYFLVHGLFE